MTILFILITILLFGALIAIHEFGHFIAAKTLGVRVEEFAIGMGPQLLSRTRGETTYSLRALPIGGFCSMEGEEEASDDPRSFSGKPAWKKFIILVAGAFLNFVTGLVILLVLFSVAGSPSAPVVSGYLPGAEDIRETGLLPGDEFYRIDGHRIYFQSDAILFLGRAGEDVAVEVLRDGRRLDLGTLHLPYRTLTDESGQQSLKRGVMVGELREAGPLGTLRNAWYQSIDYVRTVWLSLGIDPRRGEPQRHGRPHRHLRHGRRGGPAGGGCRRNGRGSAQYFQLCGADRHQSGGDEPAAHPRSGRRADSFPTRGRHLPLLHPQAYRPEVPGLYQYGGLLLPHCPDGGGGRQRRKQIDPVGRLVL